MPSCGIAICNTISAQRRKNEVIGNDCQAKRPPARSTQSQVPGISTYFCTPFYSIDIYIFFFLYFPSLFAWPAQCEMFGIFGFPFLGHLLFCQDHMAALFTGKQQSQNRVDNQTSAYKTQGFTIPGISFLAGGHFSGYSVRYRAFCWEICWFSWLELNLREFNLVAEWMGSSRCRMKWPFYKALCKSIRCFK